MTVEYGPDPDAHSIVKWSFYSPSEHYRFCTLCHADDTYEFQMHQGGTATCTSYAVCDVCETPYGEFSDQHGAYTDWDYADDAHHYHYCTDCGDVSSYEYGDHYGGTATCYAQAVCKGCGWDYGEDDEDAQAWGEWMPDGDGSHITACHYCGEELTVPCTVFTAELFAACPICGKYEGGVLLVVYAHDDDESLPYGTLVIYGGEIPVDGAIFAITVAGSYGGNVVELTTPVTVSVPMGLTGFRVVDMNGEEIPFTLEDGVLTFETAAAGLFLLVPAE